MEVKLNITGTANDAKKFVEFLEYLSLRLENLQVLTSSTIHPCRAQKKRSWVIRTSSLRFDKSTFSNFLD
ncbi:hypothetical protein Riv7116_2103 [Rivularia sp. PCC 7116]|nr:hypothetical protein Riv7116_2103 [Rivularia sp. PCC 7116]